MSTGYNPPRMTTVWDIIEAALARQFRPPRDQQWLAASLHVTPQAVHNWKKDGVPARRYRDIATLLNLTVDQLEGLAPLPWDAGWPFPDIEPERYYQLDPREREQLQAHLLRAIEDLERARRAAQAGQGGLAAVKLAGETKAPQPHPKGLPAKRKKNGPKG